MTILILPSRLHTLLLSACFQQDNQHCCAVTGTEYIHLDIRMHWYICTPSLLIVSILLTSPTHRCHPTHSWTVLSDSLAKSHFLISPFTPRAYYLLECFFPFVESFFFCCNIKSGTVNISLLHTPHNMLASYDTQIYFIFCLVYIIYKKNILKYCTLLFF